MNTQQNNIIWIDMDNSPHVVFFIPIIKELRRLGFHIVITVRDCFQVCGLADMNKLQYKKMGRHFGKNKMMKAAGLVLRSLMMIPFVIREKPKLALSHGSRSQLFLANLIGMKSILIGDYEYASSLWMTKPTWMMAPDIVARVKRIKKKFKRIVAYPGIKEDVYVPNFVPDNSIKKQLNIAENDIMITIRPPATEAHYFKPESEQLFRTVIETLSKISEVQMVLLPRNEKQFKSIQSQWLPLIDSKKIIIPQKVIDGLNLMWNSDLVISGGGTMNREAAALNLPVYSIFRGDIGAVDQYLVKKNRLVLVTNVEDIATKILIRKRKIPMQKETSESPALKAIVKSIVAILENMENNEKRVESKRVEENVLVH
ncbi:MAG: DUF354 domain-containing protein [Chitinivibrionales bacterium]|nr:DUF354 domain-containing protein [Chitinivibrionales bacterium]